MPLPLSEVLSCLERLAPLGFAESWDNVGLLLQPKPSSRTDALATALLTIDLSDDVVDEAERAGAGLIVAYHPPIFQGLKRLRHSEPAERVLLRCAAAGIAIFSPHTALDAAPGGVNDWLLDAFATRERWPCLPHPQDARFGQGRGGRLIEPLTLSDAVARIKAHLGLELLRVAAGAGAKRIERVAVCAGAGGSVFERLSDYDLLLTGEMRHHDVRSRAQQGTSVVLCDHTNTERGYLPVLSEALARETSGRVTLLISACDRDPLLIS